MCEWQRVRLSEVCSTISDGDHLPPPKTGEGIPFVTISDIRGNKFDLSNTRYVPKAYFESIDEKRRIRKGDVLYSVVGSYGIPVYADADIDVAFQRHIAILKPNKKTVSRYLYYSLLNPLFYKSADNVAIGAAQKTITLSALRNLEIDFPPLPTQRKIAKVLSAYDDLIENNTKRIRILERMAEELYKEWFVRFRFPGHEKAKFVNGLPEGWRVERLNRLLDVRYGKDHKNIPDGDIPIFGSGGVMRYGTRAQYDGESVLIPRKGSLNNIMYFNGPFWTVDTMFYSIPVVKHIAKYMYFTLAGYDMESFNTGAALPSMTTDILSHFKIVVPAEAILQRFDQHLNSLFSEKDLLQRQNALLARQRDLLLPRLMSGKLSVEGVAE